MRQVRTLSLKKKLRHDQLQYPIEHFECALKVKILFRFNSLFRFFRDRFPQCYFGVIVMELVVTKNIYAFDFLVGSDKSALAQNERNALTHT